MYQKSSKIKYIIVQAGGKGNRLNHLTINKPKALVSINGKPILFHLMSLFPSSTFLIIGDYKSDIFQKYLDLYSPAKYYFIKAEGKGTCAGIKKAIAKIPLKTPFLISWCDLYFSGNFLPEKINNSLNYIGLSNRFLCRWRFKNKLLEEKSSKNFGVAGIYLFRNKKQIGDIPVNGEFCKYLQKKKVTLKPFFLKNTSEVGNLAAYKDILKNFPHTRPFNQLIFKNQKVIKKPVDQQGRKLAKLESDWYSRVSKFKWDFIPKVYKKEPLEIERLTGKSLYAVRLSREKKIEVLKNVINNLKTLHGSFPPRRGDFYKNDKEAIIDKTKRRLDQIASLIPDINQKYIIVNNKKCLNFYKEWHLVDKLVGRYFTKEYKFIHGDLTFSNILFDEEKEKVFFLDPRGYYGRMSCFGDEDYDWAKLYYSLVGNYDQFNIKNFRLVIDKKNNRLEISSNGWEFLEKDYFKLISRDEKKIKAYHAIIWLSLTTYVWDNYDSIAGAFYRGIKLMQEVYEKTL